MTKTFFFNFHRNETKRKKINKASCNKSLMGLKISSMKKKNVELDIQMCIVTKHFIIYVY